MTDIAAAVMDTVILKNALFFLNPDRALDWDRTYTKDKVPEYRDSFFDLCHNLLLYDKIFINRESFLEHFPIDQFEANNYLHQLSIIDLFSMETKDVVREALWCLIHEHPDRVENLDSLLPRTYLADADYYDFREFSRKCWEDETNQGLSSGSYEGLIRLTFFIFRGMHYTAYANGYAKEKGVPAVYVASRARLSALERVLSRSEIERYQYVKTAYADLLDELPLPEQGYDFSIFSKSFMAHELSRLRLAFNSSNPTETITAVLQMRNSKQGENVRQLWAERIWKSANSCAIGQRNQSIENVTAHGNVNQIYLENIHIHASAHD